MIRDTFQRIWQNIYLRVLLIIAVAFLLFYVLHVTRVAWVSFIIAFLIAYLVEPLVDRLERSRLVPRWLSVAITMLLIILFFIVGVVLVGEVLAQFATLPGIIIPFLNNLPTELEKVSPPWLTAFFGDNTTSVQAFYEQQRSFLVSWFQGRARLLVRGIGVFFGGLGQAVVIVFLSAFIISSYSAIQKNIYTLFPSRYQEIIQDLITKLDHSVGGYIRAQVFRSIIVGFIIWITLLIIGVPKAAAIAFITAFLNPIPYLGPSLATIPAVLSALTVSWQIALITLIACIVIQVIDGNVLQPLVLSQGVSVHPVTVLVSLLIGGALFGFWGIMLSIPVAAFLQLVYQDYYLKSKWYLGIPEDTVANER
jgi:predicted PurR-regulated permease PerM